MAGSFPLGALLVWLAAWVLQVAESSSRPGVPLAPPVNATPPAVANWEAVEANWKVKRKMVAALHYGDRIAQFLLDGSAKANWGSGRTYLRGALWAPGLPHLELLMFHRRKDHPPVFVSLCMSIRLHPAVQLVWPSGTSVTCHSWWPQEADMPRPMRVMNHRKKGASLITHVRYYCPVPAEDASQLPSQPRFRVVAHAAPSWRPMPFRLTRTIRVFQQGVICSQPLWNTALLEGMYPHLFHEWIAYHLLRGFGQVAIYDLIGQTLNATLAPWVRLQTVQYYSRWATDLLAKDSGKHLYCLQCLAHDHCLFVNQLTSTWAALVHGPDLYTCTECQAGVAAALSHLHAEDVGSLNVGRREVVAPPIPNVTSRGGIRSLLLSFNQCTPPSVTHAAPIMNPRNVLATFVHSPLVVQRGISLPDIPVNITAMHYFDAFKKAKGVSPDVLRGKEGWLSFKVSLEPVLMQMHPEVDRLVQRVLMGQVTVLAPWNISNLRA
eukprot:GGOE01005717.1.p1 GENE.GGOE01005717.1~~GGOE01005717.1.p1  ORF type:complete len:508 (-),score=102.56 GGOE01005717.1:272-1750(-)